MTPFMQSVARAIRETREDAEAAAEFSQCHTEGAQLALISVANQIWQQAFSRSWGHRTRTQFLTACGCLPPPSTPADPVSC